MSVEWVTFDCYGTLIDWEQGITDALLPLLPPGADRGALAEWYIAMEAQFEAEGFHLYKDVLDRVGRRVLRSLEAPIPDDKPSPLPSSLADWRPFPEVRAALRALVDQGRYLAITAEDSRSYKPAPGHWRRVLERSGAAAERTVHVGASQFHDMRPAAALGFRTVFIDRHGETLETSPTRVLRDLSTLPDVIAELAAG